MTDKPDFARSLGRRDVLRGASAGLLAAPFILRSGRAGAADNLVFVTWGGTYRTGLEKGLIEPFTKETGIGVTVVDTPDLAKVKAQVTTGNVEWDVFDAPGPLGASGSKEGFWQPIDKSLYDESDLTIPLSNDLVPIYTATGGIAFDPERYPAGKRPMNFAQYFDTKGFPGRRTFRSRISETLEAALLADGVPPAQLYPLDVERGFKMLDRVKPSVVKWVEATPQTITLLQTNETDFTYTYATRAKTSKTASGGPFGFSFDQTFAILEYFCILKGAPHKEAAQKFIAFALRPDRQAAVMDLIVNAPVSKKALPLLSAETRQWLPERNPERNVLINDAWWAGNFDRLNRRFKEWLLT